MRKLIVPPAALSLALAAAALAHAAAPAPYTAEYTYATIISRPDGTTENQDSTEVVARDGRGRSVKVQTASVGSSFQVRDPAAHTTARWSSSIKQATVTSGETGPIRCPLAGLLRDAIRSQLSGRKPAVEDLGTKTIAGVEAHGVCTTTADPPLVTVDETWSAVDPALNSLIVRETSDIAPRHSGWARTLTSLKRGEPDPKLFAPPADYEIVKKTAACTVTGE